MRIYFFILLLFSLTACNSFHLKEGDLLFQDIDCGPMCDAIEAVTEGVNQANFSHIALVVKQSDHLFALEAISAGVVLTPINDFLNRSLDSNNNPKVAVGRLKSPYTKLINSAINTSLELVGAKYDNEFLLNNKKYYCSELIYEVFKKANNNEALFKLQAMTFKQPHTSHFYPVWETYYSNIGIPIPEGKPGLNPGGISSSPYIKIVKKYGQISGWKD
jgi:hypothetical protein